MNYSIRSREGFTLVEIMIVVVLIGLLAGLAIPSIQKVYRQSVSKELANDARQIGMACTQIAGHFPAESSGLVFLITVAPNGSLRNAAGQGAGAGIPADEITKYVKKISRWTNQVSGTISYTFDVAGGFPAFRLENPSAVPEYVIRASSHVPNQSINAGDSVDFDEEGKPL